MASTYTDNFELVKQGVGDNVDTWGAPTLNTNMIQRVDDAMGKTTTVTLASTNVTLTQTQWRSKAIKLTGTLSASVSLLLPLSVNSVGSATAVGGEIIIDNQTTGAFTVTVKTAATASTGVEVSQGYRSTVYSDTVNVTFADDQSRSTVQTYAGNPNGFVAGTAGSSTTPASVIFDRTNAIYYVCTTAGVAAVAVWTSITGAVHEPQCYVTASSDANNVVLTADAIGVTTIYVTPYNGNSVPIWNGVAYVAYPIAQLALVLTASQAALGLYDVVIFIDTNTGLPQVGFSPSWAAGSGGSVTAGSCARGTGVGGAAIQKLGGLWVNAAAMTVNNGATTYSVAAQRGTILATAFIDSTQGQLTCHVSYGQSRKCGISNFYNRLPIYLKAGDPNSAWTYTGGFHPANGSALNSLTLLSCLPEEVYDLKCVGTVSNNAGNDGCYVAIGYNNTSAATGINALFANNSAAAGNISTIVASYLAPPAIGINVITALESVYLGGTGTWRGTAASMMLSAQWEG